MKLNMALFYFILTALAYRLHSVTGQGDTIAVLAIIMLFWEGQAKKAGRTLLVANKSFLF